MYEKPTQPEGASPSVGYVSEGPSASCYCTGACRNGGVCPNQPWKPYRCGHFFPWYSVIPPTYCPICGAYLGPVYCPPCPQPQPPIYPTITYSTGTGTTAAAPKPQGETISASD